MAHDVAEGDHDLGIDGLSGYRQIGSGGFATVYSAWEADAGRQVVVKVLGAADEAGRRRFERERLTMGQIGGHPNVVTLLRSGYLTAGGQPYLVMEHLAGGSLQDRLDAAGPLPWDEALRLVRPVADALAFSHGRGILHRDVKPANILVSEHGEVKLSDFGIAAIQEATASSQLAFSLSYTAPETFDAGRDAATGAVADPRDERSDRYSLAATLYALGTGRPPFEAATAAALMAQIVASPVPETADPALDRFFATALAKAPGGRQADAAAFAADLDRLRETVAARPAPAGPPGPGVSTVAPGSPATRRAAKTLTAASEPPAPPVPRHRGVVAAALVAAVMALGLLTMVLVTVLRGGGPVVRPGNGLPITALAALADGRIASAEVNGRIHIWDPGRAQAEGATYTGHQEPVETMIQLADGRVASGDQSGVVQLWDPDDPGAAPAVFNGHLGQGPVYVRALLQLGDGRVLSQDTDQRVLIWDPADPSSVLGVHEPSAGTTIAGSRGLTLLGDGRVVTAGAAGKVDLWDPDRPEITIATADAIPAGGGIITAIAGNRSLTAYMVDTTGSLRHWSTSGSFIADGQQVHDGGRWPSWCGTTPRSSPRATTGW